MISKSMMKKYFDRWTDSSYSNDVITTSIGYNYIDEKEDFIIAESLHRLLR